MTDNRSPDPWGKSPHLRALDEMRWIVARLRLDRDSGASESTLAEESEHVLALLTDEPCRYSDGSDVWTHRRIVGHERLELNNPPHRPRATA